MTEAMPSFNPDRIAKNELYALFDESPDAAFDSITGAAAHLCHAPIAFLSLLDPICPKLKSCIGMEGLKNSYDFAFCHHAVLNLAEIMEVEDAALDIRFNEHPLVTGDSSIRFYAGKSLASSDGVVLATLCIADRVPRSLTPEQHDVLDHLGEIAIGVLEERLKLHEHQDLEESSSSGFGDVLEASSNEIFMFDESSLRFVHVNQGACKNLGYSMNELRGMTPLDFKPEFTLESFETLIKPLRDNERSKIDFTTIHKRKDGSTYPVEIHLQRSTFKTTPVFAAIVLDITERTQTEQALAQARLFLESAPDATVIVNSKGNIEVANSQTVQLLGYSKEDLRGMAVETLLPTRFRREHVAHRESFTASPKVRGMGSDLDLYAVTKAGDEVPIEVSLSPIETGDGVLIAAAIRDITPRKEAAETLQLAKEVAESATATKSRFLAAASHDLRQPLQSIGLYLSVLDRNLQKQKNLEISEKIRNSLVVMGELLDALLDISKLDSGSVTPAKKDFCIQTMFDQMLASSGPHASEKGLAFNCHGSTCIVHSDPALLQRVVENFVSNAIRYTDSGSVDVSCQICGDHARISVKDSGSGIPENALNTIFEEYFQLGNPVRDRRKGLGLGLSIVKHIAKLLDHPLHVASVIGTGSIFSIDVPLGQSIEQSVEKPISDNKPSTSKREPIVLLVDDDPAIVDATEMLLAVSGFQVYSALNGDEALQHIARGISPDIVVSDYRLPGYNGVEVVRRVREATTADLPSVLMTGDTSGQELEQTNMDNCTVLHKPVDTDQLILLIKSLTA